MVLRGIASKEGVYMAEYASILKTVKEGNEIEVTDTSFDQNLIVHINSTMAMLTQIGVGRPGFKITGDSETWEDYITDIVQLEMAKEYITKKVRSIFNPPRSSFLLDNLNKQLAELEYRLNLQVDP